MIVPVENIVDAVDLTPNDALLPMYECIVNSIISLKKANIPLEDRKIQIKLVRGDTPTESNINNIRTIKDIIITDNGQGFTDENYSSYETPFSKVNKSFGCKGVGRFTALAAFERIEVESNYYENDKWYYREFDFDAQNEITKKQFHQSEIQQNKTTTRLLNCFNRVIKDKTAKSTEEVASSIMNHCLVYYLCNDFPHIEILDFNDNDCEVVIINELFDKVSKERERDFRVDKYDYFFKAYIIKTEKTRNRKNNYIHYCANSREVGNGRNIGTINSLFNFPLTINQIPYFIDVYIVSDYLDNNAYSSRNGFKIPVEKSNGLFDDNKLSFQEIEEELSLILEDEYNDFIKEARNLNLKSIENYVIHYAPRYRSLLRNKELIKSIPFGLTDDKKEEYLYKISYEERKRVEGEIRKFIYNKQQIDENSIEAIKNQIKDKTSYGADSLADYMIRRKAIIDLFDKLLEADEKGDYKLEEDIHNFIFPMGLTSDNLQYESHNLWLLDERFVNYHFIASDKPITSISQKKSRKEPDLLMFNNPICFGENNIGEITSMVIFEFKRPGEIAHQKNKTDYRWEFSELIEIYFDDFLYKDDKKNYKGRPVIVEKTTPKFGYIIVDVIPKKLEEYNRDKGWEKTPFGSFYKIIGGINLHIEVLTFQQLAKYARLRHNPFFDKLFI
ncbi:MAG: hypothetical protein ACK5KT_15710 [Dysgonomonas sp.]